MRNQAINHMPEWTILKTLQWTAAYFKNHQIENPRTCAEILLAHTLNCQRLDLYLQYDKPLSGSELARFKGFILRRLAREPVAYIEGCKGFWKQVLAVSADVLIPRPETECLVENALMLIPNHSHSDSRKSHWRILELGVGSGAISLALLTERPNHWYWASDYSLSALRMAKRNIDASNPKAQVQFVAGDWFKPLAVRPVFDLIVSNPPYIRTKEIEQLQPEIHKYEPHVALDGGVDGLKAIRLIIQEAHHYLKRGGELMLEIGHDQSKAVRALAKACGKYEEIQFIKDDSGYLRVLRMRRVP